MSYTSEPADKIYCTTDGTTISKNTSELDLAFKRAYGNERPNCKVCVKKHDSQPSWYVTKVTHTCAYRNNDPYSFYVSGWLCAIHAMELEMLQDIDKICGLVMVKGFDLG